VVEESNTTQSISRLRRVTGICLLALGILVVARDVWLGVLYWSVFRAEERIRFVFWLWLGTVLTVAGFRLSFRLRGTGWLLILVIASLAGIAYSYGRWWS
jgi:hypothetical protein